MEKDDLPGPPNLRRIDGVRLKGKSKLVDEVIDSVQTSNITEDNKLVKCGAFAITQLLGIKEIKNKKKEKPFWKRRIQSNINALRKDVSLTERWETRIMRKESQKTSFSPVISTNVGISLQNVLPHWCKISKLYLMPVPKY